MDAEAAEDARQGLETLVRDLKAVLLSGEDPGEGATEAGGASGSIGDDHPIRLEDTDRSRSLSSSRTHRSAPLCPASRAVAARRLVSLSEELRTAKLEASELRRHVAGLRDDRRHLEKKLAGAEAAARTLEVAKAEAETRAALVGAGQGTSWDSCALLVAEDSQAGDDVDLGDVKVDVEASTSGDGGAGVSRGSGRGEKGSGDDASTPAAGGRGSESRAGGLSKEEQRLLAAAALPAEVDFGGLDPEETIRRLQQSHAKVNEPKGPPR